MRKKMVWRYYCDFCKKAGCGAGALAKHERHCCRNPQRVCRMCKFAGIGDEQRDMVTLRSALLNGGLEELTDVAQSCPACILSALVQDRMANPVVNIGDATKGEYIPSREYIEFDYRAACRDWFNETDSQRREEATWR